MKLQDTKNIIELANQLEICKRELFDNIKDDNHNFEVENYKFITEQEAFDEVINMYECDTYILGCFNASFIEDFISLSYDDIKELQKADAGLEIIGKLILNSGKLNEFIEEYIRLDGYGHALNSYDHSYDEITLNNTDYICLRTN